jgi:hypothetical protein
MKTITQQLNVKDFPFEIRDKNNNEIYYENSNGHWWKQEYDSNNNRIYIENSDGGWWKQEYDSNNNVIYFENSDDYWEKREYNSNNNLIYFESSKGSIIDKRPKSTPELTMEELVSKLGYEFKIKK